ncbi:MAG: putative ABC transporter permease [Candidatus Saccharibacteria bacterium]|nr:putative ABC transporter permease [Candidatus Saccharibacteria bacterium]
MKKQAKAKSQYRDYLEEAHLDKWQRLGVILLVIVVAGFIGWTWEFILAEFKGGFRNFYVNGGNLLPWMNLYAYGAIVILLTTYRMRKHPWAVFLTGAISTGLLEWFAGWLVYTVGNGTRYWDYSDSAIGIGHINGFVCPASACVFGLGALLLVYCLLPHCIKLAQRMSRKKFLTIAIALFSIIIIDDLINLTLKNLDMPTAQDFYVNRGWVLLEK